jgi:hypothetical protein
MRIKILLFIIISSRLNAQPGVGARMYAMAASGVAISDIWSINVNQAGITALQQPNLALDYQKNFTKQSISAQSAVFAMPFKKQILGLSVYRYGWETYRHQEIGFTYARRFGPDLAAAMAFRYQQLSIENYGKSGVLALDAGLRFQLNSALSLGAHIGNLSKNALKHDLQYADRPLLIQFGAAYQSSKQILLALAFEQGLNTAADARMGLEYQIIPLIALRGGLSVHPFRQYGGVGLALKKINLDMAFSSHQALGYSTQISLGYVF